jgi:hypothetical protein
MRPVFLGFGSERMVTVVSGVSTFSASTQVRSSSKMPFVLTTLFVCPWTTNGAISLKTAVGAVKIGGFGLNATSYGNGSCHQTGELRSSWIHNSFKGFQQGFNLNCRF